jgi:hypothetical protein
LNGGGGDHLLHFILTTFRTFGDEGVRKLLDLLETVTAHLALVLVERHEPRSPAVFDSVSRF